MAATIASTQILKETENKVSIKFVGATGPEVLGTLVDASTLTGATGLVNLLSVAQVTWTINDTGIINLLWDGTPDTDLLKLSRSGDWQLKRNNNILLSNNAASPTGDILITSSSGNYTLILDLEKVGDGWTKIGQYTPVVP